MAKNALKQKWSRGEATFGAWLSIPSSFSAEAVGHQGFDYVCVDLQHGLIDYATATEMLLAIHSTDAVPIARVPSNDFGFINKLLDAGAMGIVVPLVNSGAEAEQAVRACRYPPEGARSFGPTRAAFVGGPDYFASANDEVACIPMIETKAAVDAIDDILAVPGVDAIYVGPNDLSLSLGLGPGPDNPDPYQQAYRRIAKACEARKMTAGIHANRQLAAKHVDTSYRMITVTGDLGALVAGARRDLKEARGGSA